MAKKASSDSFIIVPAAKAAPKELAIFFDEQFPTRKFPLKDVWKWQNRASYTKNKTPLVMLDGEKVIAHAGIIPFKLQYKSEQYKASWYIDFMVHQTYRRQGLGLKITQEFMGLADIHFAVTGNEKSMGAFRKLGWLESELSYFHYIPLRPFYHPKIAQKLNKPLMNLGNALSSPFIRFNLAKFNTLNDSSLQEIKLSDLQELVSSGKSTEAWTPIRDMDYWKWRLLNSPDSDKYLVFNGASKIIIKINESFNSKIIDVLFIPPELENEVKIKALGELSKWALKKGFHFIRLYTTNTRLSTLIRKQLKSYSTNPEFAVIGTNEILFNQIKSNPLWEIQFIDNDFESL